MSETPSKDVDYRIDTEETFASLKESVLDGLRVKHTFSEIGKKEKSF